MSDFAVSGSDLKALIKVARKGAISFAFNPGKGPEEHMLGLHKLKSPDALALSIKKSGTGPKVSSGTCLVEGKLMQLTTETPLPGMAKKLKAFLRVNAVKLNVVIMGPDGAVLEEDVEQLPDEPDDEDEGAGVQDAAPQSSAETVPDSPDQSTELARRLAALQPAIKTAPEALRAQSVALFTQSAGQIKTKDFEAASAGIDRLEKLLAQDVPTTAPDQTLQILQRQQADLQKQVDIMPASPLTAKLSGALELVSKLLGAGQMDQAAEALRRVQAAMPPPTSAMQAPPDLTALRDELRKLVGQIAPIQDEARKRDLAVMASDINMALKNEDGPLAEQGLGKLRAALAPPTNSAAKPMLPIWRDARERTNDQLNALQSAMRNHGMPLFARIADKGLNGITESQLVGLQVGLMNLDAAQGAARQNAIAKLRSAMADMRQFLQTNPALSLLDKNPLNVPVSLRDTLGSALDAIETALAMEAAET